MSVAFVRRSESVPNRSNPYTSEPTSQQARVLPRGQAAVAVRTGKQTVAGPSCRSLQMVIDGPAGGFGKFEFDRPSGFLLANGRAVGGIAAPRNLIRARNVQRVW